MRRSKGGKLLVLVLAFLILYSGGRLAGKVINKPKIITKDGIQIQEVVKDNPGNTKTIKEQNKIIIKQSKTIEEVGKELQKYKQQEQEEKLRKQKIKAMQQPEIITKEMSKVGELITYKGKIEYNDIVSKKSIFKDSSLNIHITYEFGFGIDLNEILVSEFIEDAVVIQIPKSKVELKYIEIIEDSNKEVKTFLGKEFSSEEMNQVIMKAQVITSERLNNSLECKNKAIEGVKDNLEKMILKIGYRKIIFEQV